MSDTFAYSEKAQAQIDHARGQLLSSGSQGSTGLRPPAPQQPLSEAIRFNDNAAFRIRNGLRELKCRLYGFPGVSPMNTNSASERPDPDNTADMVRQTADTLAEIEAILGEIHSRF